MINFFKTLKDTSIFNSPTISTTYTNVGRDAMLYLGNGKTRKEYLNTFGISGESRTLINFNIDDDYITNVIHPNVGNSLLCSMHFFNNNGNITLYQDFDANIYLLREFLWTEGYGITLENKTEDSANWFYYSSNNLWPVSISSIVYEDKKSSIYIDKSFEEFWWDFDVTDILSTISSCSSGFMMNMSFDTIPSASAETNNYTTFISKDNYARKQFQPYLVVQYDNYCQDNTQSLVFGVANWFGFSDYENIIIESGYQTFSFSLLNDNNELLYTVSGSISSLEYNPTFSHYSISALIANVQNVESWDYYIVWSFDEGSYWKYENVKLMPLNAQFSNTKLFIKKEGYANYESWKIYTYDQNKYYESVNNYQLLSNEAYYRIYYYDKKTLKNYYLTGWDRMSYKDNFFYFKQPKINMSPGTYNIEFKLVINGDEKIFNAEGYNFDVIE